MRLSTLAFAGAVLAAGPAFAQAPAAKPPAAKPAPKAAAAPTAQAARPVTPSAGPLDVKGFRSAAFGMTPAQVRSAIATDFGAAAKIDDGQNPREGTEVFQVKLDHMDPGPGPAEVVYIFGAGSKTLSNIIVSWTAPGEATQEQRDAMLAAGGQLVAYFQNYAAAKASPGMSPTGPNGLVMYAAVDKKNAGVDVQVDGISYQQNGTTVSPKPTGPASLRVTYVRDADKPDVKTLKPGSF